MKHLGNLGLVLLCVCVCVQDEAKLNDLESSAHLIDWITAGGAEKHDLTLADMVSCQYSVHPNPVHVFMCVIKEQLYPGTHECFYGLCLHMTNQPLITHDDQRWLAPSLDTTSQACGAAVT